MQAAIGGITDYAILAGSPVPLFFNGVNCMGDSTDSAMRDMLDGQPATAPTTTFDTECNLESSGTLPIFTLTDPQFLQGSALHSIYLCPNTPDHVTCATVGDQPTSELS